MTNYIKAFWLALRLFGGKLGEMDRLPKHKQKFWANRVKWSGAWGAAKEIWLDEWEK